VKAEEVRVLEADELDGKLKSSRRELYELRFKLAVGQLDDHRQIRKVRADIARLLTFKRQRELGLLGEAAEPEAVRAAPAATAVAEPEAADEGATEDTGGEAGEEQE
jgi:large subunit ribosomal protein L29